MDQPSQAIAHMGQTKSPQSLVCLIKIKSCNKIYLLLRTYKNDIKTESQTAYMRTSCPAW